MIHTMSITKAAIGLMYHLNFSTEFSRDKPLEFTTIGKALNMRAGKGYPKGKEFDFNTYRCLVEGDGNLRSYAVSELMKQEDIEGMDYSDLTYQLLASNMPDVADRFGIFMGDKAGDALVLEKSYNGKDIYFKQGKGWKWEHTESGEPLGPHGLHMTQKVAIAFGEKAKPHVLNLSKTERTPCEYWFGIGKDEFTHYWNGWFFSKNNCAYAVGYVVQVIAILPNGVVSQLYEEDWEKNPMDSDENKRNNKRWDFIKNIETFQTDCEQKTNKYLNTLVQPPNNQQGASIIMPSGSGKSTYVDGQKKKDEFIDCDPLTWFANAQPHDSNCCPWNWDDHLKIICLQVDRVVAIAKKRRFWIMGATWWNGDQVNAIVILNEEEHRKRLEMKEDKFEDDFYDKTIKAMLIPQLLSDRKEYNIPVFTTIDACVEYVRMNFSTEFTYTKGDVYKINNKNLKF